MTSLEAFDRWCAEEQTYQRAAKGHLFAAFLAGVAYGQAQGSSERWRRTVDEERRRLTQQILRPRAAP